MADEVRDIGTFRPLVNETSDDVYPSAVRYAKEILGQ